MTQPQLWTDVDDYFTALLAPPDDALSAALRDSDAAGLPRINVTPNQGKLLHLLARIQGASRILEIGTLGGYSTIWLARALPEDGRLITLEYAERHALEGEQRSVLQGLSLSLHELPLLVEGMDLAGLYELATELRQQGIS